MSQPVEVEYAVLKIIYDASLPAYYRLKSTLEDVMANKITLSETEMAILLEYCSCSSSLKLVFEDIFSDVPAETKSAKLKLSQEIYTTILGLAKTVELASRSNVGNIVFWSH